MLRHLRYLVVLLICLAQIACLIGCADRENAINLVMNANRTPDERRPALTQSEIEMLVNRFSVTRELAATEETMQILLSEDTWPDHVFEIIMQLPTEQISDEAYYRLARMFLLELTHEQQARFIELCFNTYEHPNDNTSVFLKVNTTRVKRLRYSMEQLLIESLYQDREMLHKYGLFVSASFIPVAVSNNPKELNAFSVEEHVELTLLVGADDFYTYSLIFNYIGFNQKGRSEVQNIRIFKTAVTRGQLSDLSSLSGPIMANYTERILAERNLFSSRRAEEIAGDAIHESAFNLGCSQRNYAYTRVDFSDESLVTLRMIFPLYQPCPYASPYGEHYSLREDGSVRGRLIVAKPLPAYDVAGDISESSGS